MAKLVDMKTYKEPEQQPKLVVDMDIIEYFYVATLNEILADDSLVKLIVKNGYYQQALCESQDVLTLTITCNGVQYTFVDNRPPGIPSTLEMLQGKTKYTFPDTKIINLR